MLVDVFRVLVQQIVSLGRDMGVAVRDIASAFVSVLATFFNPVGVSFRSVRKRVRDSPDVVLEKKLLELSEAMARSSSLVVEVEDALRVKQALVDRLKTEAELATTLASLSQEQRDAVARMLRSEVDKSGRKALWLGVLVNLVFFGLGVLVSALL